MSAGAYQPGRACLLFCGEHQARGAGGARGAQRQGTDATVALATEGPDHGSGRFVDRHGEIAWSWPA
jgi:hypothetical protein